jgi:hypothetical protein
LIDESLNRIARTEALSLLLLVDELRTALTEARRRPTAPDMVLRLRSLGRTLSFASRVYAFATGTVFADSLNALASRLLVRTRVADSEWYRVVLQEVAVRRCLCAAASEDREPPK